MSATLLQELSGLCHYHFSSSQHFILSQGLVTQHRAPKVMVMKEPGSSQAGHLCDLEIRAQVCDPSFPGLQKVEGKHYIKDEAVQLIQA